MRKTMNINGKDVNVDVDENMPLLWFLRDELELTGTKYGCGIGTCGACTVHVDGAATRACLTPVSGVMGKQVTTIEGLSTEGTHPLQKAWLANNVPQCGYCQAGQIMGAADFLKKNPEPKAEDVDYAMSAHICRCGTYQRIKKAILEAAAEMQEA
ncbi:MAG: isoquinoline 1-oxidoreductase alpha subunit [Gammaproteobacteria bacterium]|jgi:isoquinoline 1-oxidoreductase alpha subunit